MGSNFTAIYDASLGRRSLASCGGADSVVLRQNSYAPSDAGSDRCVLYPAPLRDLLMQLALTDLYRARWTEKIHEEWMRNVLKNRPDLSKEQLERTKSLMNRSVRDCLIEGYEFIIPSLDLPDPDDRHILAAAIIRTSRYYLNDES